MTVMTRKKERLLDYLIGVAGDPLIVQRALRELNAELTRTPTAEDVLRRIFEIRTEAARSTVAAGVAEGARA